jgi:hypothetical protein
MKTYLNERFGFEMDIPSEWTPREQAAPGSVIFMLSPDETVNLQAGPMPPNNSLEQTESEFRRYAQERGYTGLDFGRITAQNKAHLWVRYRMGQGDWSKKYMLEFGASEYAITGTCFNQKTFAEKEKIWDEVAASFRLVPRAVVGRASEIDQFNQAYHFFETGYDFFRSGDYTRALEHFERGKLAAKDVFPGNYFGVSMTLMQMIEVGAVARDELAAALQRAEENIDVCLGMVPWQPDYQKAKKIIQDYKKKRY